MPLTGGQPGGIYFGAGNYPTGSAAVQAIMQGAESSAASRRAAGAAVSQAILQIGERVREKQRRDEFTSRFDALKKELAGNDGFEAVSYVPWKELDPSASPLVAALHQGETEGLELGQVRANWLGTATRLGVTEAMAGAQFDDVTATKTARIPNTDRMRSLKLQTAELLGLAASPQEQAVIKATIDAISPNTHTSHSGISSHVRNLYGGGGKSELPGQLDATLQRQFAVKEAERIAASKLEYAALGAAHQLGFSGKAGAELKDLARGGEMVEFHKARSEASKAAGQDQSSFEDLARKIAKQNVEGELFSREGIDSELSVIATSVGPVLGVSAAEFEKLVRSKFTGDRLLEATDEKLSKLLRPVEGSGPAGAHSSPPKIVSGKAVAAGQVFNIADIDVNALGKALDTAGFTYQDAKTVVAWNYDFTPGPDGAIKVTDRVGALQPADQAKLEAAVNTEPLRTEIMNGIGMAQGTFRTSTRSGYDKFFESDNR